MEVEVRAVAGIDNCYASLPLFLINALESGHPDGRLPALLPLELRLLSSPHRRFYLAWSGSSSSSSAIEIAQEFAECIGLPDHAIVQVRALSNVPKASFITIEPLTEDDWEVLELNSEAAEAAILSQVRVVHEKMKFPLWLHGHRIVTFTVISMIPNKAVVQLVPGSEVAVAPKRRKKSTIQSEEGGSHSLQKALLRVQDPKRRLIQQSHIGGGDVGIELTSVALTHPETAKSFLFDLLQAVVIVPRLASKLKVKKSGNNMPSKDFSSMKEQKGKSFTNEEGSCYAVVHLLFSESVGKGHLMLCQSLRSYLRVSVHSWVYVQRYANDLMKDLPLLSLSPCQFVKPQTRKNHQNRSEVLEESSNPEGIHSLPQKAHDISASDGSLLQEELVSALTNDFSDTVAKEVGIPLNTKDKLKGLLYAWLIGQLHGINSISGGKATSLVLGPTTFLCFKLLVSDNGSNQRSKTSTEDSSQNDEVEVQSVNELLYVLNACAESLVGYKYSGFELSVEEIGTDKINGDLKLVFDKVSLGSLWSYKTCNEYVVNQSFTSAISSLSWMGTAVSDVVNRLMMLLSPVREAWFSNLDLPFPGHILIYGPPGSGKTLLASAAAKSLESNKDILVHTVFIPCSTLAVEKVTSVRQMLCEYVSDALEYAPSVIIFDDLDSLITSSSDFEGSQMSASVIALAQFITGIMDEYEEKRKNSCGLGPIAFVACVRNLDSIPQSLRASGRFDFHVQLPAPSTTERLAILRHEIQKRSLQCSDDILLDVASKSDGYDSYDLAILVDRSVHGAISRFLPSHETTEGENPSLTSDDFSQARNGFLPVSMRDITKSASDGGRSGWEDVGGLIDVRNSIKEMIELPSKFPHIFGRCPLRLRSNVLLYGPPGCGKTHIVGAAAAASSLRFISIKGPELLNKYIGASEQAVRDVFAKAAAAAPCILFFDEFDSIAPKRGHDNTGVTDRVVNQFLTELDGVEVLTGVFVFAATSRPDLLDAALLRPGRLDRLLFCDFPGLQDRLDILRVLSSKLPLADNVDLESVAHMTDGFSGADLQALLSDAQLAAVQELLDGGYVGGPSVKSPLITRDLLIKVASKAKPSVSESEKQRLFGIYNQFLDSKRSVASQSRDAKGKRATLA